MAVSSTMVRAMRCYRKAGRLFEQAAEEHRKQTAVCAERWGRIRELEAEVRARARTITELMGRLEVDKERTGTMTAEQTEQLRADIARARKTWPKLLNGDDSLRRCIDALESTLPATPEPRWPEGMEAWESDAHGDLYTEAHDGGRQYYVALNRLSELQRKRIAHLLRHAEWLETAMFAWHEARAPRREYLDHEGCELFDAIAAYRAEGGEG